MTDAILPDILAPGLRVLFCGSAAGTASARLGAYYAGRGNKFWPTLHRVGLTPYRLLPGEFRSVGRYGIGLTDLCKSESGADSGLSRDADDVAALAAKLAHYAPAILAFNGKRAARVFLRCSDVGYGAQPRSIGSTAVHILPSTSGAANGWWDEAPWRDLAAAVARLNP